MKSAAASRLPALCLTALLLLGTQAGPAFAARLPDDVARFVERRERCDHFRGEDSDDPERRAYIAAKQHRYCKGSDIQLRRLKARYRQDLRMRRLLKRYETPIE
ncbi:hypothetical protein [Zoogloea sp.]|uniref:hypothetical protein n=1 Tax=Zoogloea sp. TaxID=49181 RepID=UPI00261F2A23|nr:hypothetical protein [Zoogloea sp.]